mmetsp:Transcript_10421/g.31124  ORF Transcript_10421/g.31124 Transcript_10421/m.31124 type:complete len:91 (+) Transcript_10421:201-473(+)
MSGGLPSYFNASWRLDVEVAKRAKHGTAEPTFVVKLDTLPAGAAPGGDAKPESRVFQADMAMMRHLEDQLRAAVASHDTAASQRTMKYIR